MSTVTSPKSASSWVILAKLPFHPAMTQNARFEYKYSTQILGSVLVQLSHSFTQKASDIVTDKLV